ncbi:MAG TPA: hypothetical protein VFG10_05670 [Saprospiraceae bacterium]|nr:hypothetical protein [Saprospiraceae bacterium]
MKILLLLLLVSAQLSSFAQKASTWKGNAIDHSNDWNWPGNWSNNSLPDEFTDVCIPYDNTSLVNYPVIKSNEVEINSLFIAPGAMLVLEDSQIYILDPAKSFYKASQITRQPKAVKWKDGLTAGLNNINR